MAKKTVKDQMVQGKPAVADIPEDQLVEYDVAAFEDMKDLAMQMKQDALARDELYDELVQYWNMDWLDQPELKTDAVKVTISPDMSNKLVGAWRLLSATEAEFQVARGENADATEQISSEIEKAAKIMWQASGKSLGMSQDKEAVLSALMFAKVDILLTNLLILGDDDPMASRVKDLLKRTPMLFEVVSPRQGYSLRDRFGLTAYLRVYETDAGTLKGNYPGYLIPGAANRKYTEKLTVREMTTLDWFAVWVESDSRPFYWVENDLGFIPVVSQITEGTNLFVELEKQVRPFLFAAHKSGIGNRQNLALTSLYTTMFAMAMAMAKHRRGTSNPTKQLEVNNSGMINVIELDPDGEDIEFLLNKGSFPPEVVQGFEIAQRLTSESTIYSQALGEPLGGNAPYSMVALLHQAGRLPLVNPKELTEWALGAAMELGFRWLKVTGKKIKASNMGMWAELSPADIPDDLQVKVKLEIDLPQDMGETARTAQSLRGLADKAWIRENVMPKMGNSDEMQENIWSEDMAEFMVMQLLQRMQAQEQQAQAAAQGGTPGGGEGGGTHTMPDGTEMPGASHEEATATQNQAGPVQPRPPMAPRGA